MARLASISVSTVWLLFPSVGFAEAPQLTEEQQQAYTQKVRLAAKTLGQTLKSKLVKALSEGGPLSAIDVCAIEAPEIAETVSDQFGVAVGRRALKVRNSENAPDAWETEALLQFDQAIAAGDNPTTLETSEIVDGAEGPVFRWAKAIPTGGPCLTCHGPSVKPEIRAAILERYPSDKAVGFKPGSLRGIFTVSAAVGDD